MTTPSTLPQRGDPELHDAPLVTIVIPSFNQGSFIAETLQSCFSQDYRPLEVLVLDGGSTDSTVDILKSFERPELVWQSKPDGGVVSAVNEGLAKARGSILSIQSSDDTFAPGAIRAAVDAFRADPALDLVYGDVELMDEASRSIGMDRQGAFDFAEYLGRFSYIPQPGTFFSRTAKQRVGGWRAEVSYAADADFWMRVSARGRVLKLDRTMGRYRYHENQRDTQKRKILRDWEALVQDQLRTGQLTQRERRYALMGIQLARHRYTSPEDWQTKTVALYRAAFANPRCLLDARFPKQELLPGRASIWKRLSRVKRWIGLPARR